MRSINYNNFKKIISKASGALNKAACFGIVAAMAIVTINVILRAVFKSPIIGTHEYMCFLTMIAVGCSLAYCALSDGHISIGFIMEKLKGKTQKIIGVFTQSVSFLLMCMITWSLVSYGGSLLKNGQVALTTKIPLYIFVYIMAAGFLVLCFVLLIKIIDMTVKAVEG